MRASVSCHRCMEPLWFSRAWYVTLPCQVGYSSQECKGKPGPQGLVGLVSLCRSCRSTASSILRDFFRNALPIFCSLSFGFVQRDPATPEIYWFLMFFFTIFLIWFAISGGHVIFKHTHLHSLGSKSQPHARHWSAPCRATPPTWAHLMGRHGKPWASARPMATQLAEPKSWRFWSVSSLLKPWNIGCHCAEQKKIHWEAPSPMWADQLDSTPTGQPANRGRNIRVAPGLARTLTLQGAAAMQTQIPRFNGLHLSCLQGASWFMTYHTLWVQHQVRHSWGHLLSNSRIFDFWWLGLAQYSHKWCKHNLWNSASHNQLHGQTTPQFPLNLTMPNTYITPWSTKRPPAQCCLRRCLPRKLWVPFWVPALDRTRINGCFNLIWFFTLFDRFNEISAWCHLLAVLSS